MGWSMIAIMWYFRWMILLTASKHLFLLLGFTTHGLIRLPKKSVNTPIQVATQATTPLKILRPSMRIRNLHINQLRTTPIRHSHTKTGISWAISGIKEPTRRNRRIKPRHTTRTQNHTLHPKYLHQRIIPRNIQPNRPNNPPISSD